MENTLDLLTFTSSLSTRKSHAGADLKADIRHYIYLYVSINRMNKWCYVHENICSHMDYQSITTWYSKDTQHAISPTRRPRQCDGIYRQLRKPPAYSSDLHWTRFQSFTQAFVTWCKRYNQRFIRCCDLALHSLSGNATSNGTENDAILPHCLNQNIWSQRHMNRA